MKKTGFDWCFEANIRVIDIENWDTDMVSYETSYYTELIDSDEFYRRISLCNKVKANSMPRKTDMWLEYRMYGLVPYNMSPIQQGIQFGHAVVDYARTVAKLPPHETIYNKFADKDKTFIILNGGTTNTNPERLGSLNVHTQALKDNGVLVQTFNEPDLGDQLTAVVFLVDERVFNRELYPEFVEEKLPYNPRRKPSEKEKTEVEERNKFNYQKWVEKIGGPKNAFLREFLRGFRLA